MEPSPVEAQNGWEWEAIFLFPLAHKHACLLFWGYQLFWPKMHVTLHIKIFKNQKKDMLKRQRRNPRLHEESGRGRGVVAPMGEGNLCITGPWQDPDLPGCTWAVAGAVVLCEALGSFCQSSSPSLPPSVMILGELLRLCEPFLSTWRRIGLIQRIVVIG